MYTEANPVQDVAPPIQQANLAALKMLMDKIDGSLPGILAVLEVNQHEWRMNPARFLANADKYVPTLRNSYESLRKSSTKQQNSLSDSFHLVNLQLTLEGVTRRQNLRIHSVSQDEWRRSLSTDFHMIPQDDVAAIITNIERQLKPVDALMKLLRGSSGMLAVVAPALGTSDLKLISEDQIWTWLSPRALAESMKYEAMCTAILRYLRSGPNPLWKNDELIFAAPDGQCFSHLCKLLLVAGGSVPVELWNGTRPSIQRLDENGQNISLTISEAGIDQSIVMAFETGVDQWFLWMQADNGCVSRLEPSFQVAISSSIHLENTEHLRLQLLIILINAMPLRYLDIDYDPELARTLTPLLLRLVTGISIPQRIADCVLEALLTAMYCASSPTTRTVILDRVSKIVNEDSARYLQLIVGAEISTDRRLRGELDFSNASIHDLCCPNCRVTDKVECISRHIKKPPYDITWRVRVSLLRLHCSYIENLLFMRRYDIVQRKFDLWQPEFKTQKTSVFTLTWCKILRVCGKFAEIRSSLTEILRLSQCGGITRAKFLCTLSEALGDLIETVQGQSDQVVAYTKDLTRVRKAMVEQLKATKHDTKLFKHLLVCLLETSQPGVYVTNLDSIINHLSASFKTHLDLEEQELHVRFLIARAQHEECTYKNTQATSSWKEVQHHLKTYTAFAKESFAHNITQLSIWWLQSRTSHRIPNIAQLKQVEQITDYRLPKLWAWGRRITARYTLPTDPTRHQSRANEEL